GELRTTGGHDLQRRTFLETCGLADQLEQPLLAGLALALRGGLLGREAPEVLALRTDDAVPRRDVLHRPRGKFGLRVGLGREVAGRRGGPRRVERGIRRGRILARVWRRGRRRCRGLLRLPVRAGRRGRRRRGARRRLGRRDAPRRLGHLGRQRLEGGLRGGVVRVALQLGAGEVGEAVLADLATGPLPGGARGARRRGGARARCGGRSRRRQGRLRLRRDARLRGVGRGL